MEKLPIKLVGLKHAFGERTVENGEIEDKYGLPKGWILEKTGKEKGHAWNNGPDAPIKASIRCLDLLLDETGVNEEKIRAVFGTTNPLTENEKPKNSLTQRFVDAAGLHRLLHVSDESFGCGGPAIGMSSMSSWFESQHAGTYAIYVTQDWPTKMVKDRNVEALFSDAVSVSLWVKGGEGVAELGDVFSTESNIAEEDLGIIDGFWEMDGKEVCKAASSAPAIVAKKLKINLADFDIVPQQSNARLLETIESIYGIPFWKKVAQEHGNPTCSGSFIALDEYLKERKKATNDTRDILVMPFGAGGVGGFILKPLQTP